MLFHIDHMVAAYLGGIISGILFYEWVLRHDDAIRREVHRDNEEDRA